MGPNRTNYQVWLIDYLDGALDRNGEALLLAFLESNPDLKEELNDLITISIKPGYEKFSGTESLKRDPSAITPQQFGLLCVGALENDLSEEQRSDFEASLAARPEYEPEYRLFTKSVLKAPELKFRYKNRLKKQLPVIRALRYSLVPLAAAAAVLLLITLLKSPVRPQPAINNLSAVRDTTVIKSELPVTITKPFKAAVVMLADHNEPPVKESPKDSASLFFIKSEVPAAAAVKGDLAVILPDLRLAKLNITPVSDEPDDEGPRILSFISKFFREKINKSGGQEKGPLKAYEVADAGITGLNKLLGWDMTFQKQRNLKGEVTSVSFNSKLLKFNAPVKRGS